MNKVVNVFDILSKEGAKELKKYLKEQDEKTLYRIQAKYFTKAIRKDKEKQIDNILRKMNHYLNLGYVFSNRSYIDYTEIE